MELIHFVLVAMLQVQKRCTFWNVVILNFWIVLASPGVMESPYCLLCFCIFFVKFVGVLQYSGIMPVLASRYRDPDTGIRRTLLKSESVPTQFVGVFFFF